MYYVPYAHNHVNLYGAVVAFEKDVGAEVVCVDVLIQTVKGEEAKPVRLLNRRALEMVAFYETNQQMYPNEPFLVNILGHIHVEQGYCRVIGDSVAFMLTPDVRTWGTQMVFKTLQKYEQIHGPQPWLESVGSSRQTDAQDKDTSPEDATQSVQDSPGMRQRQHTGR